jgi:predicted HTH transcriptional regulator
MALATNINDLLNKQRIESNRIEFKKGWNPASIYHSICAFANDFDDLGGGYIIVGVDTIPIHKKCTESPETGSETKLESSETSSETKTESSGTSSGTLLKSSETGGFCSERKHKKFGEDLLTEKIKS